MKVNDILTEGHDLDQLKAAIAQGQSPTIINARSHRDGFAWGDLEKLGLATKHKQRSGRTTMEEYWEYTGPNSITCNGNVMGTGDTTDVIEVDYS